MDSTELLHYACNTVVQHGNLFVMKPWIVNGLATLVAAVSLPANAQSDEPPVTFEVAADAISETMHQYHFDPAVLSEPEFLAIETRVRAHAERAQSREDFVEGFNQIWRDGPFSHVVLRIASASAEETATYLDTLRVGETGASLTWSGDVAVLTVTTMMGLDTIEQIDAAYAQIADRGADALIIDLRDNGGGAFAVRPLVGHVLQDAHEAGVFTSRRWTDLHDAPPTQADAETVVPWEGWSVRTFWRDVQDELLIRVQFQPIDPAFDGPVFVLTSSQTASASELAVDALQSSGRAVVLGEQTAGEMLSQKLFDIPQGFHLYLPIADYFSAHNGRIEGVGVAPDIAVDADEAMAAALERAGEVNR